MPVDRAIAYLRNSLWVVPGLWVVAAAIAAFGLIAIDTVTPSFARSTPLLFGGGADGARSLLSSIASSAITVAGVTFSITVVALQLASTQFSPSVLRNFMRDRVSQMVLGSFIGTFFYSLLVLRSVRGQASAADVFVPSLAVTGAIVFAVIEVAMLVYFIHHIASRIQVATILATVSEQTLQRVRQQWRDSSEPEEEPSGEPSGEGRPLAATDSGFLQLVDRKGLTALATELDLVIRVEQWTGEWVQEAARLFSVWPPEAGSEELTARMMSHVTLGAERSLEQDAAFGIRQLVDVASKALSPGMNAPTTAVDCLHRLTQLLVTMGVRREPQHRFADERGRLRLVLSARSYDQLVALAYSEIRHYGATTPAVAEAMAESLDIVIGAVPEARHGELLRQARLLSEQIDGISLPADRQRVAARLAGVLRS